MSAIVRDTEIFHAQKIMIKRRLPMRQVGIRYGVGTRPIRRWEIQKIFPPPDFVVNLRKYWLEMTL